MKHLYRYITMAVLTFSAASCDRYLEENPDNRVELNTPEKAAQLLTNAYNSYGYTFTEWMSDNVSFTRGTSKQPEYNQAYRWEDITSINQDTPNGFWTGAFDAIAHSNEVLAVIGDLPGEREYRRAIKAEALLTRAYNHFMLVNIFAKHYDPATAEDDPGIPYVLEPETVFIKTYERLSVQEVYDLIEEDLLDGLDDVNDSYYANSGKYHFTKNAALAFASRFYLYKRDFNNCIRYSSQLLGSDPDVFIKDIYRLLDETFTDFEFTQQYTSPSDASNLLLIRNVSNFPVNVGYWPDIDLIRELYLNNPWGDVEDARIALGYPIYERGTNGLILNKFEFLFERSSLTSNVGLNYTIMPVFRGEEVLLNRAECNAVLGNIDLALADLQVFVSKRYLGSPAVSLQALRQEYGQLSDQELVFFYTQDERRKEFIHEGLRWFDIKRFKIPVTHQEDDGSEFELQAEDNRKVIQLPQTAIDVGGLEPNPR